MPQESEVASATQQTSRTNKVACPGYGNRSPKNPRGKNVNKNRGGGSISTSTATILLSVWTNTLMGPHERTVEHFTPKLGPSRIVSSANQKGPTWSCYSFRCWMQCKQEREKERERERRERKKEQGRGGPTRGERKERRDNKQKKQCNAWPASTRRRSPGGRSTEERERKPRPAPRKKGGRRRRKRGERKKQTPKPRPQSPKNGEKTRTSLNQIRKSIQKRAPRTSGKHIQHNSRSSLPKTLRKNAP